MSATKMLNAILAFIEGRPEDARIFMRSSEMPVVNSGEIQARIAVAITDAEATAVRNALREILTRTLALQIPEGMDRDTYLRGVTDVEEMIERVIIGTEVSTS